MTEKEFKKAEKLKSEIKDISTTLKYLSEIYYGVTLSMDNGIKETEVQIFVRWDYPRNIKMTTENVLGFIESEIKTLTDRKKTLETVFKEL